VSKRCKKIDDGLAECYNLKGPYEITIMTDPPLSGSIRLNTQTHTALPWKGSYFGNMFNKLQIYPQGDKKFLNWKSKSGKSTFSALTQNITDVTITAEDTLIAVFEGASQVIEKTPLALKIFPNPASDIINVSFPESYIDMLEYEIFTADGKRAQKGDIQNIRSYFGLNINRLLSGNYILICRSSDRIYEGKLVIAR
jgi:hypothetical protein